MIAAVLITEDSRPLYFPGGTAIESWDIFSPDHIPLASTAHATLLDLLAACHGPRDAEMLKQRLNGATQEDIAKSLALGQSTVSRALTDIYRRAQVYEQSVERLGMKARIRPGWRALAIESKPKPSGLRFGRHPRGYSKSKSRKRAA